MCQSTHLALAMPYEMGTIINPFSGQETKSQV